MKILPFSKIRNLILILSLVIFACGVGYQFGQRSAVKMSNGTIVNTQAPSSLGLDFSLFWDVWQRVHRYYIDADKIDNQKLIWGAISGMVSAVGDPYTVFLPPTENQDFKNDLSGSFEGIGAQLGLKDNRIIVVAPLKGSPAEKVGIKAGDWIIKVEEEDTLNWTVTNAVTKIRGKKGTPVMLTILHEDEQKPVEITIIRDTITVPSVEAWVKKPADVKEISGTSSYKTLKSSAKTVSYIVLSRFGDRLAEDWQNSLNSMFKDGLETSAGIIFDLRNNPGGYLDGSVYIASEFLSKGIVVSQQNSGGTKEDYQIDRKGRLLNIPLVVLVNKGSASAAEIVAGALKDYKRATIVGETSFGKGSVQTPQDLPKGAGLHVTTGKWLTPHGDWISEKGIKPDIEVTEENPTATNDAQLAKAIEILLNK